MVAGLTVGSRLFWMWVGGVVLYGVVTVVQLITHGAVS